MDSRTDDRLNQILQIVQAQPGISVLEISLAAGIHRTIARRHVARLKARQLIWQQEGKNRSGHWAQLAYPVQPKILTYANVDLQKLEEL